MIVLIPMVCFMMTPLTCYGVRNLEAGNALSHQLSTQNENHFSLSPIKPHGESFGMYPV